MNRALRRAGWPAFAALWRGKQVVRIGEHALSRLPPSLPFSLCFHLHLISARQVNATRRFGAARNAKGQMLKPNRVVGGFSGHWRAEFRSPVARPTTACHGI